MRNKGETTLWIKKNSLEKVKLLGDTLKISLERKSGSKERQKSGL